MLTALLLACTPPVPPGKDVAIPVAPAVRTVGELGAWPFLTPIDAPATVALVGGGELPATAVTCGGCHADHYREWGAATHASAIHDLQYLAELAKPGQPRWLCLNCHAPTAFQRAESITPETTLRDGLAQVDAAPNPGFEAAGGLAAMAEGVTCATCHVRRDADGLGVVVGPRGSGRAPHRVRADKDALTSICVQCHSPGPARLSATFTCWFESAEELAAGPDAGKTCTSCHMPEVERPAAAGAPAVTLRRHVWVGGGVPKSAAGYDTLLERGWEPGLDVAISLDPARVVLTNARAGHLLPTADPERFLRVEARIEAADGAVLGRDVLRIGQSWDWGDEATGRLAMRKSDNRLRPGEAREWSPALPAGGAALVVEVAHVRVTAENAAYMAGTTLDAELAAMWPEAPSLLPHIDQHYPMATYVWRERVPLDGGARSVATRDELIAASKALLAKPLSEKAEALRLVDAP